VTASATKRILVTGGAGLIGSAVARHILAETAHDIAVVDRFIEKTIDWYVANRRWWSAIRTRTYGGERLGLNQAAAR
jgi:dTDP-D-glucose 4,6-dehydratase